jgi:diguanylate cyclase (GGDEF)-like protein
MGTHAASPSDAVKPDAPAPAQPRLRHRLWSAIAATLAVCGVAGAVLSANAVAQGQADKVRRSFEQTSADIGSTLQLAIQHESDLVVSAGAYAVDNPNGAQSNFVKWTDTVRALQRYPELQALGVVVIVPAAQLAAFAKRETTQPTGPLATAGTFTVVPAGPRATYCLVSQQQVRTPTVATPAGFDLCAGQFGAPLLASRDSGVGRYQPYKIAGRTWLGIQTPIYSTGFLPATIAERRAAFAGWVGDLVDPAVLLDRALQGHPGVAVQMRFHSSSSDVAFASGTAARHAQSVTADLGDGWTVSTSAALASGGIFGASARTALLSGIVLSLLLSTLVFVLGTGRERARRLVTQRTSQLRHQALHDALTGLPNRALVMDRIEQLLTRDRRYGTFGAALFLDIDDFKNINDTLGHQAGDQLLEAVAARLNTALRDADTVGRMGGDEFVVLIDGAASGFAPEMVAERLLDVMRQPFALAYAPLPITVSISIGIAVGDRDSAVELLRDADVALYQAKALGKNRYELFRPEMQSTIGRRNDLEFELRSALAGNQYRLMYQPIYDLSDLSVIGVEALLRWDHPTRGLVPPDEFIPLLEQSGGILEVGRWVLREACTQMALWHGRGDTLSISVNVSGRQLDHDSVVTDIRDALELSGLDAESLIVEVTETALMGDMAGTARRLRQVKELGVKIAVDDFGTGYSSLAYLRQFPVDCLKIDRMFTNAISTSPESKALIGTLVQLGRDLGLQTLAEGVETTYEMDVLRAAHVDQAQGFLMARPLDPAAIEAQLLEPSRRPAATTT